MQLTLARDEMSPGTAGAFACPPAQPQPVTAPNRTTPRALLQQLEALAQQELAALERQAAAKPTARARHPEQASLAWDLGLDAAELAGASG